MNDIVAVVVTYNRKKLLSKCIRAIINQKEISCDIIVIDNGSSDGTEELFKSIFNHSSILYTNTGKNIGCAAGTEMGMRMAVQEGYKYIWVMDDDVIPKKKALYELHKMNERLKGNWGILSSVAIWRDGTISEANRQKKNYIHFYRWI